MSFRPLSGSGCGTPSKWLINWGVIRSPLEASSWDEILPRGGLFEDPPVGVINQKSGFRENHRLDGAKKGLSKIMGPASSSLGAVLCLNPKGWCIYPLSSSLPSTPKGRSRDSFHPFFFITEEVSQLEPDLGPKAMAALHVLLAPERRW